MGEHLGIRSSVVLHASASEHVVQVLLPAPVYTCLALSGELDLLQAYLYQNLRNQPFSVFDRKLVLCPTDNGDYEQLPG